MKRIAMGVASMAMVFGGSAALATPAQAAPNIGPIAAGNLVNVQVSNVLNNNDVAVTVPIQAAVNICDLNVAALAELEDEGTTTCDARNGMTGTATLVDQRG